MGPQLSTLGVLKPSVFKMASSSLLALPPNYGNEICETKECQFPLESPHYHIVIALMLVDANNRILIVQEQSASFLQNINTLPYYYLRKMKPSFEWMLHKVRRRLRVPEESIRILKLDPVIKEFSTVRHDHFAAVAFSKASLQKMGTTALRQPIFIRIIIFTGLYNGTFLRNWHLSGEPKVLQKSIPMNDLWQIPNARLRRAVREAIKKFRQTEIQVSFSNWRKSALFASVFVWQASTKPNIGKFNYVPQVKLTSVCRTRKNGPSLTMSNMSLDAHTAYFVGRPYYLGLIVISSNLKITFLCKASEDKSLSILLPQTQIEFFESQMDAVKRIVEYLHIPEKYFKLQKFLKPINIYNIRRNRLESLALAVATFCRVVNIAHNIVLLNTSQVQQCLSDVRLKEIIFNCVEESSNYIW